MSLKEYLAKRNFRQTREPQGETAHSKARQLHFVVQKHDATRLHYDFRLEMEGVLKSWAVPKGFPFTKGDRRLAVEVEDHPMEYGGFEGTIPEGNYGAGSVMLWDRGTYSVFGDDPLGSLKAGKLHFVLNGKKLKGEWALVRMRNTTETKPQWLLLKSGSDATQVSSRADDRSVLTGRTMKAIAGAAEPAEWHSNRSSEASRQPATRRAQTKTPAAARSPSPRSNRSKPATGAQPPPQQQSVAPASASLPPGVDIAKLPRKKPGYIEPMKARLAEKLPGGREWGYEIKFDGVRALAIKNGSHVSLLSRTAKDLSAKYPEIVSSVRQLNVDKTVLDGEVIAVDEQGRASFQLLQSYHNVSERPPLFYYVFDAVNFEGHDITSLELTQRKQLVESIVSGASDNIRLSRSIPTAPQRLIREMQSRGLEGLVAKKCDSPYEPGRRSGCWVKYKWCNEQEFVVGGYTQPQGARAHFGALLVGYYQGDKLMFAGKVGTGFDTRLLEDLYGRFQALKQPECPFANLPESASLGRGNGMTRSQMRLCTWVRPELVCQVRFSEWTRDHHLRQPAFLGMREDKAREVVREAASSG